jgi:hypothetical protein
LQKKPIRHCVSSVQVPVQDTLSAQIAPLQLTGAFTMHSPFESQVGAGVCVPLLHDGSPQRSPLARLLYALVLVAGTHSRHALVGSS